MLKGAPLHRYCTTHKNDLPRRPTLPVLEHPIAARAHDAMHVQHKYWSRKPANVVRAHIEAATGPGEIILDPFCGSGTTVSQAVITGRKCIGLDINPVAVFIARNTITPVDTGDICIAFNAIKSAIEHRIHELYVTRCPACLSNDTTRVICVHWKVHHPVKVHYTCSRCNPRKTLQKVPDAEDLVLLEKIDAAPVPCWYPGAAIPEGVVFNQARRGVSKFSELFTKRNLAALSLVRAEIERATAGALKEAFLFAFTSMVHLCSRMTPVRPSRPLSSFWATNSYWLPRTFMESNVWMKFESAITGPQGLLASKRDANAKVPRNVSFHESFADLASAGAHGAFLATASALDIDRLLPPCSVDHVFTDPPYAGAIPYMELSTLWALWLGIEDQMDREKEILVDEARGKTTTTFLASMEAFFEKAFTVLKPGRFLTFTYHNLDDAIRRGLLVAAIRAGFTLVSIVYQPPPRKSPAHTLRPFNSAIGDYIVHFHKQVAGQGLPGDVQVTSNATAAERDRDVVTVLERILEKHGKPMTYTDIINATDVELASRGWFMDHDAGVKRVLKRHPEIFSRVEETIGSHHGVKWWLQRPAR